MKIVIEKIKANNLGIEVTIAVKDEDNNVIRISNHSFPVSATDTVEQVEQKIKDFALENKAQLSNIDKLKSLEGKEISLD